MTQRRRTGDEVRKGAIEAGCDSFIPKPLSDAKVKAAYENERKQEAEKPPAIAAKRETPKHEMSASDLASLKLRGRVLVADNAVCMQAIIWIFLQGMELDADMADNGKVACDMAVNRLPKDAHTT